MGKIKSAIITAILVAAIVVLAFFAAVSYTVPGSNGVKRYNSFITSIKLGGDLTGMADAVLYPDGVITAADFEFGKPDGGDAEKLKEYEDKYSDFGSLFVDKEKLGDDVKAFKAKVKADAEILSKRLGEKGYSAYSVSVQDELTIKVSVPTGFTYAEYKSFDSSGRSEATSAISQTVQFLTYNGELSLRNSAVGKYNDHILTPITVDITSYFKSFTKYSAAGNHAVKVSLTKEGRQQFKNISASVAAVEEESNRNIGFYVGDTQLLALTVSSAIDQSSFYITVPNGESVAQDYAIVLDSVANGKTLALDYKVSEDLDIVYSTAALGDLAPVFLFIALLLIAVAAVVYSIVRYKKLGLVSTIMIAIYALAMVTAIMLLEIELTLAGAFTIVLGLALMCGSNFALFENVRKETQKGKTMQSSVKSGYKNLLTGVLELHIVLVAVALMLALICVGELASCGFIFFIGAVASYILYWFTRFMWYVISSPVRDKFAFCGFAREELEDD